MLTKALAIDFGGKFRVNCIEPAAIDTKMLRDGFNDKTEKWRPIYMLTLYQHYIDIILSLY